MKLRGRATRARTIIKRDASWIVCNKSEKVPPQQKNALYKPLKDELEKNILLNIKQEDTKDETLNKDRLNQAAGLDNTTQTREMVDVNIKPEDILKNAVLDTKESNNRDCKYRCRLCSMKFNN